MKINRISMPLSSNKTQINKHIVPFGSFDVELNEYNNKNFTEAQNVFNLLLALMQTKGYTVETKISPSKYNSSRPGKIIHTISGKSGEHELKLAVKLAENGWWVKNNGETLELDEKIVKRAKKELKNLGI